MEDYNENKLENWQSFACEGHQFYNNHRETMSELLHMMTKRSEHNDICMHNSENLISL
jgi:hypothetical protein